MNETTQGEEETTPQFLVRREPVLANHIAELERKLDLLQKELKHVQRTKRDMGLPCISPPVMNAPNGVEFMTIQQLVLAALQGHFPDGATGNQLVDFFKTDWGRKVAGTSLSPQLSRLRKKGLIEQHGRGWRLTKGDSGGPVPASP